MKIPNFWEAATGVDYFSTDKSVVFLYEFKSIFAKPVFEIFHVISLFLSLSAA